MPSDNPHITTLNEGCLLECFRKVIVIVFHFGFNVRKKVCEFLFVKTRKTKVEVETFQLLQFHTQEFFIPTRIKRHSVVRQNVCFLLRFGEMVNEHARYFFDAFRFRRHNSAVSCYDGQIPINDDWVNEAELTQRRTQFQNLLLAVGSGIVRIRHELIGCDKREFGSRIHYPNPHSANFSKPPRSKMNSLAISTISL